MMKTFRGDTNIEWSNKKELKLQLIDLINTDSIYEDDNGEVGNKVGKIENGEAIFF